MFNLDSSQANAPAQIKQCEWKQDESFVSRLRSSWHRQYAEYIGSDSAECVINHYHKTGKFYDHNQSGTLIATLNTQKVGIVSIRDLDKIFLITLLEVLPEHQRKGIANQLLHTICTVDKPLLAHVSVHRPWLKKVYATHGFVELAPTVIDHFGHSMTFDVMARA